MFIIPEKPHGFGCAVNLARFGTAQGRGLWCWRCMAALGRFQTKSKRAAQGATKAAWVDRKYAKHFEGKASCCKELQAAGDRRLSCKLVVLHRLLEIRSNTPGKTQIWLGSPINSYWEAFMAECIVHAWLAAKSRMGPNVACCLSCCL